MRDLSPPARGRMEKSGFGHNGSGAAFGGAEGGEGGHPRARVCFGSLDRLHVLPEYVVG